MEFSQYTYKIRVDYDEWYKIIVPATRNETKYNNVYLTNALIINLFSVWRCRIDFRKRSSDANFCTATQPLSIMCLYLLHTHICSHQRVSHSPHKSEASTRSILKLVKFARHIKTWTKRANCIGMGFFLTL